MALFDDERLTRLTSGSLPPEEVKESTARPGRTTRHGVPRRKRTPAQERTK